jgi:hypothetical protein
MTEGLNILRHGGPFITSKPAAELSASEAVLGLLTGPLKTFSDRVDAVLASQAKRIEALEKQLAALQAERPSRKRKRANR